VIEAWVWRCRSSVELEVGVARFRSVSRPGVLQRARCAFDSGQGPDISDHQQMHFTQLGGEVLARREDFVFIRGDSEKAKMVLRMADFRTSLFCGSPRIAPSPRCWVAVKQGRRDRDCDVPSFPSVTQYCVGSVARLPTPWPPGP
jgi:hypothetical protein